MSPTPSPARAPAAPGTALYLYAVCRPGSDACGNTLTGVPGHPGGGTVRTLTVGPLTAVVQDVPAAEYTEEALRDRLAERTFLERCARTHHEVIADAASRADTLPLPLATLYLGEDSLRDVLHRDAGRFGAALDRIAGREEWGVKVYAAAHLDAPHDPPAAAPAEPSANSGRAYLDRLRDRNRTRRERADDAVRVAQRVESALRGTAVAVRRLRTHATQTTGGDGTQVLNAACLMPRGQEPALARTVTRLRTSEGVHIEVTGPWVPYSFVDDASAGESADDHAR
ncbi:GvpL/GvpF family gas vesicle protein [Streptomyces sp. DSM 42041]|uniref:GvpL/GvpF family gas vesicle protein n=1 Tax=Streptomyces hazeniae TaxID=3075538 RepID=A0ABU2P021_9ACTN|nr:GvpL/GvpF family gas vesicle protein [Streptomyces sp. DSM 42041]MDT0382339.1 GvpL/GvpF family gas vesicle protein [Streptomyces sp. DSM 42041]